MRPEPARSVGLAGGILIILSGLLNIYLGARIGAVYYEPYPGGRMGHVGVIAGLIAIGLGLAIAFWLPRLSDRSNRRGKILAAGLTCVLGHAGAVFGALYVGTAGVLLCYISGIWQLVPILKKDGN